MALNPADGRREGSEPQVRSLATTCTYRCVRHAQRPHHRSLSTIHLALAKSWLQGLVIPMFSYHTCIPTRKRWDSPRNA